MSMLMTGVGLQAAGLDTTGLQLWLKADAGTWQQSDLTIHAAFCAVSRKSFTPSNRTADSPFRTPTFNTGLLPLTP